jgi:hypothetical protein
MVVCLLTLLESPVEVAVGFSGLFIVSKPISFGSKITEVQDSCRFDEKQTIDKVPARSKGLGSM